MRPALLCRSGRARRWLGAVVLAALLCGPPPATAHMTSKAIEEWGPFLAGSVTCLRVMSGATHECFDTVLAIEQRCQDTRARGGTCDTAADEASTSAAVDAMLATVNGSCEDGQLTAIGYFGFFDAEADLFDACVRQARFALAVTYAPAATAAAAEPTVACMAATAAYGQKVMRFILERERPIMERFASLEVDGDDKMERVRQLQLELLATRQRWVAGLTAACPQFETIYRRSRDTFLRTLKQRAECVLSKTYVNTAVLCQSQVCGNAVVETPEQCDDGNEDDTDACRNDCTRAAP